MIGHPGKYSIALLTMELVSFGHICLSDNCAECFTHQGTIVIPYKPGEVADTWLAARCKRLSELDIAAIYTILDNCNFRQLSYRIIPIFR